MNSYKLGNLGIFYKGAGIPRDDANSGELPAVRYGELYTDYDTFILEKTRSKISERVAEGAFELEYGDILLAGSGETPEDIGKSAVFLLNKGYAGGDIIVFRPDKTIVDPKFLALYFETEPWKKQRRRAAQGQSIVHIHTTDLKRMNVRLPDLETQRTIVDMLNNAGNVISVIEKKKAYNVSISQYLISKLVSRDDLSTTKRLKNIASIKKGKQYNKNNMLDSGVPVINGGTEPSGYAECGNMPANTITISEGGNSCGYIGYQRNAFWLGGHCYAVLPNGIDKKALFFILKGHEKRIMRLRVGSGLPNIQKSDLENFKLEIAQEQKRNKISRVLEVIDNTNRNLEELLNRRKKQYKYLLNHLTNGDLDLSKIKLEEKDESC